MMIFYNNHHQEICTYAFAHTDSTSLCILYIYMMLRRYLPCSRLFYSSEIVRTILPTMVVISLCIYDVQKYSPV